MSANDPQDNYAMSVKQAVPVVAALCEALPANRFRVYSPAALGFGGITVDLTAEGLHRAKENARQKGDVDPELTTSWYFDSTWGGDDQYPDGRGEAQDFIGRTHLCIFRSTANMAFKDDMNPGGPDIASDPLDIAKWILKIIMGDTARYWS